MAFEGTWSFITCRRGTHLIPFQQVAGVSAGQLVKYLSFATVKPERPNSASAAPIGTGRPGILRGHAPDRRGRYCPSLPEVLVSATAYLRNGRIDETIYEARLKERRGYLIRQKAGADEAGADEEGHLRVPGV